MFFEQYSHEPYIAVARFWIHELDKRLEWTERAGGEVGTGLPGARGDGAPPEAIIRSWSGNRYSIADIALYAYTHVAEEGGFDLGRYPAIRAWLDRVADQPGHVLITQSDFGT